MEVWRIVLCSATALIMLHGSSAMSRYPNLRVSQAISLPDSKSQFQFYLITYRICDTRSMIDQYMLQVKAAPSPDAVNFVTIDPHPRLWRSHPKYRHVEVSIIDYMRQACKDILVRVHHTRREFEIAVDLILSVHRAIFNPPDNLTRLYQFPMYPVTSTTVTVTTTLTPSVDAGAVAVTPISPVSVTPTSQADPAIGLVCQY